MTDPIWVPLAAVIAIHRRGKRVLSKIGDIVIEPGDVLVLDAGPDFTKMFRDDVNFIMVSEIEDSAPPRFKHFFMFVFCNILQ